MSASRKAVREALGALLQAALAGAGKAAQAVYVYQVGDFQGQSPVVVVTSAGSDRGKATFSTYQAKFALDLHTFVLYADLASGWTEQNAEDALDTIERVIAETLEANQAATLWQSLDYGGATEAGSIVVGGNEYRHEVTPVVVTVL